jgi:predicted MFS family arabinose efflux permease
MMGLSHFYILMLTVRFISGVASAFIFVLASSIVLDKLAVTGKTSWSGLFYSGVGFGIFFSTLFIPSLNNLFEWEGVWVGLAIVSIILTIFVWFWLKDSPNSNVKKDEQLIITQAPPLKWLPWLIVAYGLEGLGYIVTGTFIVSIATKTPTFSIDPTFVWMVVGLGAIPSCIIWSTLAKKWGFVKTLVFSMILQSIGIALPVFWLTQSSFIISALLFGATFMGITTLATTLARQMSPSNSSRIIGYLTAIYAAGQMIGPTIAGILSSYTQSFNSALIGAASVVFIGALLLVSGIRFDRMPKIETTSIKSN